MAQTVTIDVSTLACLSSAAGAALEDLVSGLDDGTYEDDSIGGYSSTEIGDAVEAADRVLETVS